MYVSMTLCDFSHTIIEWAVRSPSDELRFRALHRFRRVVLHFAHRLHQRTRNINVGKLVAATNVVHLADYAPVQNAVKRARHVLHKQEVSRVATRAVHGPENKQADSK